jgi:hypothetical protein
MRMIDMPPHWLQSVLDDMLSLCSPYRKPPLLVLFSCSGETAPIKWSVPSEIPHPNARLLTATCAKRLSIAIFDALALSRHNSYFIGTA